MLINLNKKLYKFYKKKYLKYRNKALTKEQIKWEEYKIEHNELICGLDNKYCFNDSCASEENFEKYGCIYLKEYKDY